VAEDLNAPVAAGRALRAATAVDRAGISPGYGLVPALPVAGLLAVGTAIGQPIGAVTATVGAMLVGVAWRGGGGPVRPPVPTMAGSAVGLTLATLAGTLSGRWPWLHLGLLVLFCLIAGILTTLGRRGSVVGTQSVIAFVVFGRFPETLGPAVALAGLVLGGAAVQIGFASLIAQPAAWRQQRAAVAEAYRRLAELTISPGASSGPAADALDVAESRLTAPSLFADAELMTLSSLVEEGRRIRLELIGLAPPLAAGPASPGPPRSRVDARLEALAGQVRAAARLADGGGWKGRGGLRGHPTRGSRRPLTGVGDDLRRLRAAATLRSPAGRHAVRLALVVAGIELLTQRVALPRGYWAVVAGATVLRPEFGATFTRGAERLLGTFGGVLVAGLIVVALRPNGWAITVTVGVLAWLTYTVFPASFAAGTAGLTAMVVFLLHAVAPDSIAIALDRGLDTAIGGAIGLLAYAIWPTWSGASAGRLLAEVLDAQRAYLSAVLGALIAGRSLEPDELRPLARRARLRYRDAEATVTIARTEPPHGTDPALAAATLAGLRRVVYAVHALRIEAPPAGDRTPLPDLARFGAAIDRALGLLAERLREVDGQPRLAELRPLLRETVSTLPADVAETLRLPLDELVDAADTLAARLQLELP
jgi:uncharacterized membrane protein YccC